MELSGDNWEVQFRAILDAIDCYNITTLAVDATGAGDPIVDRLEAALQDTECDIVPVIFNQKTKHEMAVIFYEEMKRFQIKIPCHQSVKKTRRFKNFIDQFFSCQKIYKGQFMQLEHSDVKGAKDDYVDSLLLLLYGIKKNRLSVIKAGNNIFFNKNSSFNETARSKRYDQAMKQIKRRKGGKLKPRRSFVC